MDAVLSHVLSWPTFLVALLVFGFAPGAVLRLIALAFSRDDPRRRELLAELHAVPRLERPFWVAEQLEVALFEGLRGRIAAWTRRRSGTHKRRKSPISEAYESQLSELSQSLTTGKYEILQPKPALLNIRPEDMIK
jgi:hypothetical protein